MPVIEFSQKDLLRSKVVTPGWYRVRIDSAGEGSPSANKEKPSINFPMEGTILFNGDTGDTEFTGVPTPSSWMFNSRAMGFAVGYLESLGVEVAEGKRFELRHTEGMELDIFIGNDTYQGRLVNRIDHQYRKPRPDVKPVQKG